jgi:peptidoglycan/LPS O-acetylase OafA/YrhL
MMKRIPQLDAIRGIAVLLVLLHNTDQRLWAGALARNGWMGVDLFFVLSGFLITGILLDTKQQEGYFRNFYARRCLRIWPLYYSVLLFMFVLVPLLRPSEAHRIFESRSMPWWSYFVFLQNFMVPVVTKATGPLGVTWSLAVEEQFYLVWPLVVYFSSESQLKKIALTVICLSPALRFYFWQRQFNIYPNTFCRLDGLMAGALLAMFFRSRVFSRKSYVRLAWVCLAVGLPLAFVTEAYGERWITFSFTALAATAFVYLAMCSRQKWFQAILANRFLVYTGVISYGIYLLEKIPIDVARSLYLGRHPVVVLLAAAAATYAMALISWNLLEKPCLRFKRYFEARHPAPQRADAVLAEAS